MTFADARYMNTWFGVGQAQAARSRYQRYKADAGFGSAGFGLSTAWFFRKHWFLTADAAWQQLLASAADSPITQSTATAVVDSSLNYRF